MLGWRPRLREYRHLLLANEGGSSKVLPEDDLGARVGVLGSRTLCDWEELVFPKFWYGDQFGELQRYHAVHQFSFIMTANHILIYSYVISFGALSRISSPQVREHRDRAILFLFLFFFFLFFLCSTLFLDTPRVITDRIINDEYQNRSSVTRGQFPA